MSSSAATEAQIKRLYKESVECVAYLDQVIKDAVDSSSIFSQRTITVRNRLTDYCEKIIFLKPLLYGKKAEEIIWRKCFYEPIHRIRRNAQALNESDQCFYQMHLISAAGYYSTLLIKLQQAFKFDLHSSADIVCKRLPWINNNNNNVGEVYCTDPKLLDFAKALSHKIFVYLGDLARYRQEFEHSCDARLAEHYYHLALRLKPLHGQPHNQLGTLFAERNFGLDAALSYLRCIYSAESFMGADGNLGQLLERNYKIYQQEQNCDSVEKTPNHPDSIKLQLFTSYLFLFKLFFDDNESSLTSDNAKNAINKIGTTFTNFLDCKVESGYENNSIENGGSVLKIFICQMLLVKKLQDKNSAKYSTALSLTLSLIECFLGHCLSIFKTKSEKYNDNDDIEIATNVNNGEKTALTRVASYEETNHTVLKNATNSNAIQNKRLPMSSILRRRKQSENGIVNDDDKASMNSSDDDVIELEDDSDSELSHDEMESDHSDHQKIDLADLHNNNNIKDSNLKENPQILENFENINEIENDRCEPLSHNDNIGNGDDLQLILNRRIEIFNRHTEEMICLKILFDWLRSSPAILGIVHTINKNLCCKLVDLMNCLPDEDLLEQQFINNEIFGRKNKMIDWLALQKWEQKQPLPEDIYLRGVPNLTQIHSGLEFEAYAEHADPKFEMLDRLLCLRSFGHFLMNKNVPGIRYNRSIMIFYYKGQWNGPKSSEHVPKEKSNDKELDRKERLMRNMAKLRLNDEMENVEKVAWIPVYLVPDSSCLTLSIRRHVQRLLACKQFVIVVPSAAVTALDVAKKHSVKAREASRWLETRLDDGHKFIRVQKANETLHDDAQKKTISRQSYDGNEREIAGVIDCSAYLSRTVEANSGSTVVCILTDDYSIKSAACKIDEDEDENDTLPIKDHHQSKLTQLYKTKLDSLDMKGITVENVRPFCNRWFEHCGENRNRKFGGHNGSLNYGGSKNRRGRKRGTP